MQKIDWNKVKFRASSWGNLLAESKDKKELVGKTAAAELIKIYNREKYNRKKDIVTRAMTKGIDCEDESIKLYSLVEGQIFFKNEERIENEWFTGHPDIYTGGDTIQEAIEVDDIKSSYELDTFTPKLIETLDRGYEAQLNVYYDLCKVQTGNLVYCLVDAPESVLYDEYNWLFKKGSYISEESPDFLRAWDEKKRLLTFQDIDYRERVIKIPVPKNDELIEKMKSKVPLFRQWLFDFEKKHMNQYPKEELLAI